MPDLWQLEESVDQWQLEENTDLWQLEFSTSAVADTLAPSESFLKQIDRVFAEAVALTEARLLAVGKGLVETVGLAEGFTAVKTVFATIPETVALAESIAFSYFKTLPETVALSEVLQTELVPGSGVAGQMTGLSLSIGLRL